MKRIVKYFLFFLILPLFGETIRLVNDSTFPLEVAIFGFDGTELEVLDMPAQDTLIWELGYWGFSPNPTKTTTPYQVVFYCESGEMFGAWYQVPSGALVNAQGSPSGSKGCKVNKNKKKLPNKNTRPFFEF